MPRISNLPWPSRFFRHQTPGRYRISMARGRIVLVRALEKTRMSQPGTARSVRRTVESLGEDVDAVILCTRGRSPDQILAAQCR